jgi:CRP-like cAMP-binding protein
VERLDVVKMARLLVPLDVTTDTLTPRAKALADIVVRQFQTRSIFPRIAEAVRRLPLFEGLDAEQVNRLAGVCAVANFEPGEAIFRQGEVSQEMYVVLEGEVAISVSSAEPVGSVSSGECLGEISLLTVAAHSATATARTRVEMAVLAHRDLTQLIRLRPDIGLHLYRNVAAGMAAKLKRSNVSGPLGPSGL